MIAKRLLLLALLLIAFILALMIEQSTGHLDLKHLKLTQAIPALAASLNQAQPMQASNSYVVTGAPTISASFIDKVLASASSPAAGRGQALYALGVKYGIDPAYALAFFMHESTFGTAGMARTTLSLGNLRCIPNYPCIQGYAGFSSWEQGFEEWYKLIKNLYVATWHKVTVAQIVPTYAPKGDHNNVDAYIAAIEHAVDTWRSGKVVVQ